MSDRRRLTRRDALSGAAAMSAGALLGPAVSRATAVGARSPGGVFDRDVGALRPGVTATIALARPVCLVAVGWSAPAHAHLQLRTRRADGSWGPWVVASTGGHDGDGVRARTPIGEGIWTGRARELALRSDGAVHGVTLTLVAAPAGSPGRGPAADLDAGALPLAGPSLPAGPGQPPIIARRAWAGSDHPPVSGPQYGTIEMGIVHHTENANGYGPGDVPAMLQAIYEFHVHGRGWWDIGYNFVIDAFGRIWEARQGGIDLPVVGAQAGDWNEISFGVSMLGTFNSVTPSAAAIRALERLLAWKMALSGVPALGEIDAVVQADGVSYTQFQTGEHVRFPRIAGHRDVDSTDCPGNALYGELAGIRGSAARLLGTPATLSIAGVISADDTAQTTLALSGRLARGATPVPGAPVVVQQVVGRAGDLRTLATATTDDSGGWSAAVSASDGMLIRALHAQRPAVVSDLASETSLGSGAQDDEGVPGRG